MAWIKTASRHKSEWIQTSDSARVIWRSRWVFLRDGLLIGLLIGALIGLFTRW